MSLQKLLSVQFVDGSSITIHEDMCATTTGHYKAFAYQLWKVATKDANLRNLHLALFDAMIKKLDTNHGIIKTYTDHVQEKQDKLMNKLIKAC